MKHIRMLVAANVLGALRQPAEGVIPVSDEEAERLIDNQLAELVDDDDAGEGDGDSLAKLSVAKLKATAEAEGVDLGEAKTKAEIIAAIEAHRAG